MALVHLLILASTLAGQAAAPSSRDGDRSEKATADRKDEAGEKKAESADSARSKKAGEAKTDAKAARPGPAAPKKVAKSAGPRVLTRSEMKKAKSPEAKATAVAAAGKYEAFVKEFPKSEFAPMSGQEC